MSLNDKKQQSPMQSLQSSAHQRERRQESASRLFAYVSSDYGEAKSLNIGQITTATSSLRHQQQPQPQSQQQQQQQQQPHLTHIKVNKITINLTI
jgi:hypothetical protein